MKHDTMQTDIEFQKLGFMFECKFFDKKGDVNKIQNFETDLKRIEAKKQLNVPLNNIITPAVN
jgi:uncharacterized protein YodC (DUF2158 family)